MSNPLLKTKGLPDFGSIKADHISDAVNQALKKLRAMLTKLEANKTASFSIAEDIEEIQESIHRLWSPVTHLNSVISTPELRHEHNKCLPMISEFGTEIAQSEKLWALFSELEKQIDDTQVTERMLIFHALREFRLAGVGLTKNDKNKFKQLAKTLVQRQADFEQNLMDATDAFKHHEDDISALKGIPETVIFRAEEQAKKEGKTGWLLTLDPPTYQAIMSHAENEKLRKLYYKAWVTRASDQGPYAGKWNNREILEEIVRLRYESAKILGFKSYADLSLATKMASSTEEVLNFLQELADKSRPVAQTELEELEAFANRKLNVWDVPYYSEKLRQSRFSLSDDELRPFFPLPGVIAGLFDVANKLFEIKIHPQDNVETWHPDVIYYEIFSNQGSLIGGFYTDLYARPNKRGGAWMDECLVKCSLRGKSQKPVAHLVCNFSPPSGDDPALLTHDEVVTLFHEFGHTLHHLLTEVSYPSLSGINGVPWDAVELPSQFLENFAWSPEILPLISGHYRTGKPLPADTLTRLNASRSFQAGLSMVRQLEFALFDFRLHAEYEPSRDSLVEKILKSVRTEVSVLKLPKFNRFANTFSHIFGGSYAAGYYSYKWAEVLAADAFSAFENSEIFDKQIAKKFKQHILATGGSREALDNFKNFRGRSPSLDPLLRQNGILVGDENSS